MKLKTRIVISFFVLILIPIIFTGVTLVLFSQYQLNTIEKRYGIEDATYESLSNTTQILSGMTTQIFNDLQAQAAENPALFENEEYLETINTELESKDSYLVVRKDGQIIYCGSEEESELILDLPAFGNYSTGLDGGIYLGSHQALVKQVDFTAKDKGTGSVFIVSSALGSMLQLDTLAKNMIMAVILILIFTGVLLGIWIYRGILAPLNKLKVATQNIKEGNLDFTIEGEGAEEISGLCLDFEEMRKRLKESAEEKLEYDKENKELITNISHDLKTPITAVKGYVEGIMDGVADTQEKMDKYIKTIYNKSNEMDRLINELTFYSKIDTNRIPYTFSKIHVTDYFDDCAEDLELELEAKGVGLGYYNYVEQDVVVIADAEQIKRVINNIVSNSLKYMNKTKCYINIRVKDVGDFVQVEIEDNGKGICPKDISSIFDRFYRTDTSRNSSMGGSGIGLSIVRKIIEDHGGKVWATSKENTGTVMYFVLRKYQEVPANE
jgi:signal transduction histidine kinase